MRRWHALLEEEAVMASGILNLEVYICWSSGISCVCNPTIALAADIVVARVILGVDQSL